MGLVDTRLHRARGRALEAHGSLARVLRIVPLLTAALIVFAPLSPASAHASLVGTDPGDGVRLQSSPREIRLSFSEHVVLDDTHVEVVDSHGHHVPVTRLHLLTEDEDTEQPVTVAGALPALPAEQYVVTWRTLSADDLHAGSGSFAFGVRRSVEPVGPGMDPAPSPREAALRWVLLSGIALALGGRLARSVLARAGAGAGADARLQVRALWLSLAGALAALPASGALLLAQLAGEEAGHGLREGTYVLRWGMREAGLVLLALSALAAIRDAHGRRTRSLLLGGAALACLGTALVGHAGAGTHLDPTRVVATALHLAAALTWSGAVICLALVCARVAARTRQEPTWAGVLRSFALPASACVGVVVVTGLYLAGDVATSVDAVLDTFYGRTLLVKLGLFGVALALASVNHRRLRERDAGVPRRTVAGEAAILVGVLAATAVLTSAAPGMDAAGSRDDLPSVLGQILQVLAAALGVIIGSLWWWTLRRKRRTRAAEPATPEERREEVPT